MSTKSQEIKKEEIIIEPTILDPERYSFVSELKKQHSREEIDKLFEVITENKILGWENKLLETKLPGRDFDKVTDEDILGDDFQDKELRISKVIKGDIVRTRVKESIYMPSFKDYCLQFIGYYLNKNKIPYKQGLNEIAGLFVLLKYKLSLTFKQIYVMFVCFIDRFLTNYYREQDFYSLQSSLSLINILLKYHDPELHKLFENSLITPVLYAPSWILTLFANKCSLDVAYYFWDKLILFDDNLIPYFFIVSFLMKNRKKFLDECDDCTILPAMLSHLQINTIAEVNEVLDLALDIRNRTPNSFRMFANNLDIFNYNSNKLKEKFENFGTDKMLAMPMLPSDLFNITYNDIIGCSDEKCVNYYCNSKKENKNSFKCFYCRNKDLRPDLSYIIIDLRNFEDLNSDNLPDLSLSSSFQGFLPKTIPMPSEYLNDPEFPNSFLKDNQNFKDENYHIILVTSETDSFAEYEKEYYIEKKKRRSGSGVFFKINKELDSEKAEKIKNNKSKKLLKEFDNFKKVVEGMAKEGFKHVSFVYGGYKNVHDCAIKDKIDLLNHGKNCILCKEKRKNSDLFKFSIFS